MKNFYTEFKVKLEVQYIEFSYMTSYDLYEFSSLN